MSFSIQATMQHEEEEEKVHVFSRVEKKLKGLSPSPSECFIFRVHDQLRKVNEKAYEPNIIAIGPYHRRKSNLQIMEEHKLRYLQFRLQETNDDLQRYVDAMIELEGEVRRCYIEPPTLSKNDWVEMMLLDGFFIVEFMRKFGDVSLREKNDPIFEVSWIVSCLQRDLLLFENQLPFSVLCKLSNMIKVEDNHEIRLDCLAFNSFPEHIFFLRPKNSTRSVVDTTKNLLELVHNNWFPSFEHKSKSVAHTEDEIKKWFIPCVTKLREAGITFDKIKEATDSLDIKLENGVMKIPTLVIEDRTESFFRNLMAYEEYHQSSWNFRSVRDYVKFMDCLIDSPKDVDILRRHGIIDNWLGDDAAVSSMFNKLNDYVTGPGQHFRYAETFNEVDVYCGKTRHKWMAKLRRDYFSSPWAIISVLAAFVLIVLTVLQTVYTVMGYY